MKDRRHDISLRAVKLVNIALMTFCFTMVWYLYYSKTTVVPYYFKGSLVIVSLFVILYIVMGKVYDAFLISYYPVSQVIYNQGLAVFMADGVMFVVLWLLTKNFPNVVPGLYTLAAQIVISCVWANIAQRWYFRSFKAKKTLIIYDERTDLGDIIKENGYENKFEVIANITAEECIKNRFKCLEGIEAVFFSGVHSHERNTILKQCIDRGIRVLVIPRVGDVLMSSAKPMHLFYLPILQVDRYNPPMEFLIVKRFFDIVISIVALVIFSPVILVVSCAIKAYDKGPVFYRQKRLTQNGKEFEIVKFRSMRVDAESDGVARLSTGTNDDRITPVGRVIRAVRLDEVPQFINVLKGDMSIVGPRPERPEIARQYEAEMPEFRLRLQAKAGITGYAQVYGKYNSTPYDKLQMDLMYIANPTLAQDLGIILATFKILFVPESTDGIKEGQVTAMGNAEHGSDKEDKIDNH